jgi:hypothetical protein
MIVTVRNGSTHPHSRYYFERPAVLFDATAQATANVEAWPAA